MCPTCKVTNQPQSFTILPVEEQISSLFKSIAIYRKLIYYYIYILINYRKDFYSALDYRFKRKKQHPKSIEDVYNGAVYKQFFAGILSDRNNISLKHNTDGIAVFHSSGKDVWPVFLQINELPPL